MTDMTDFSGEVASWRPVHMMTESLARRLSIPAPTIEYKGPIRPNGPIGS